MSNLYLSRHGIWYFRKVTTLPSGKTKDIKKSLRTRCKAEAKRKVIALLTCSISLRTAPKDEPTILDFNQELSLYLKSKASHVAERELLTIERFVSRYLAFTVTPQSKRQASKFIDSLDISVATKNKHVAKIGAFFTWLNTRYDEEVNNPFDGLRVKETQPVRDKREAYSQAQIRMLLSVASELPEHKQWIIKLAIYTGMRCNEIVQLSTDDITQIDGQWCVSISDRMPHQRVKNNTSIRTIPLHSELLGFVAYAQLKPVGTRVFPEFKPYKGNCAHYFSRWFNQWRLRHNLPEFHSIRHYVATEFKSKGIELQYAQQILGHSSGSITYDRYGKAIAPSRLVEVIESLSFLRKENTPF
ncbi:site-specific integrase [Photobacterium damselae subsp. damselae]|uniref:site-specific integrase n=1 Tax=Photobacterium damselae TaxID=38293 RepID=UPI001F2C447F|nr:site-specific integrase [Photobacterium damselae]UKA05576.1 site-specific integrase [Photobacterium damselae subsp. damselae]UKA20683.1 site-specific integrase [Photobacterium damselae subsp. damselae]